MKIRTLVFTVLLAYWIWFWAMFFHNAVPVGLERPYESIGPIFEVFNRGLGDNLGIASRTPWMLSNLWLNFPCWLITWPLSRLGITGSFVGTNVPGWRLLLITILSGVQWYFIAFWLQRVQNKRQGEVGSKASV